MIGERLCQSLMLAKVAEKDIELFAWNMSLTSDGKAMTNNMDRERVIF